MKTKALKRPALILVIGLVLALAASLFTNAIFAPAVTEKDFPFTVTYQLNGETKTLEGIYTCRYDGYSEGANPRDRYYSGEFTVDGATNQSHTYTIAEKDGWELYIVMLFNNSYLMGDTKNEGYVPFLEAPYLEAVDHEGYPMDETAMASVFAAEIVSWEYPEPVENTFAFSGFSILHAGSMVAMLAAGLLTMLACMIFVKRDKTMPYKALDKISVVLNFVIVLVAIPFITVTTALLPITMSAESFLYQLFLCVPAVTAFTVAASIALRRNGYRKAGFFVQFAGPVLFFVPVVLETVFYNIFG